MKCPLCDVEMRITSTKNIVKMDGDTPHLFVAQDMTCMNKKCHNYEKVVETVENEQPIG